MEYIVYVASSAVLLAEMISRLCGTPEYMVPVYCLIFYIVASAILIAGGRFFWYISSFVGVVSLLILLIFLFGSIPIADFARYAPSQSTTGSLESGPQYFIGGNKEHCSANTFSRFNKSDSVMRSNDFSIVHLSAVVVK